MESQQQAGTHACSEHDPLCDNIWQPRGRYPVEYQERDTGCQVQDISSWGVSQTHDWCSVSYRGQLNNHFKHNCLYRVIINL